MTLDSRITEVTEIYEPAGFQLKVTFGSNIPTLVERVKKEFDLPLIEKVYCKQVNKDLRGHLVNEANEGSKGCREWV